MKLRIITLLLLVLALAGCGSNITKYEDNQVAAIVKEEEITVGDLRFLYPDKTALKHLGWSVRVELVKQEVKELNLDISEKLSEGLEGEWLDKLPPEDTEFEEEKQIRNFAESQAEKLNMDPEQYHREYIQEILEQNAYLTTYIENSLGEVEFDNEEEWEAFIKDGNDLIEELVKENSDEIQVFIN